MNSTTTAIVLCLGAAMRMRPLSLTCPKALLPFCGRPLLEYTLDQLRESEITEVIIVGGLHDNEFERYASAGLAGKMKVRIVHCSLEHGSGGVLQHLEGAQCVGGDRLLVIYGDSLVQVNFAAIIAAHAEKKAKGCQATIVCHTPQDLIPPGKPNTNYGILWLAADERCIRFAEKPLVGELSSNCASAGIFVLERSFLAQLPDERPIDLSVGLLAKFAVGPSSPIFGFRLNDGYRFDIGTIPDYVSKQFAVLDGAISVKNVARSRQHFGEHVVIGENTKLQGHNVFGNRVTIGEGCEITDCVVLDETVVGNRVKMNGVVLGRACNIQDNAILKRGTTLGDSSVVG